MQEPHDGAPSAGRKGPPLSSLLFRSPLTLFALCWLAFVGSLLLFAVPWSQDAAFWLRDFWRPYRTSLLHLLFGLFSAFSVASLIAADFKGIHRRIRSGTLAERSAGVLCTALAVVLGLLPQLRLLTLRPPEGGTPVSLDVITQMPGSLRKFALLGILGAIAAAPHIFNLFDIHVQLIGAPAEYPRGGGEPERERLGEEVLWYQRLRSQLKLSLGFIATNISIALLIAGTLSHLLKEAFPNRPELQPGSSAMAYGLYYTALIASIHVPVSKALSKMGEVLADRLIARAVPARATWKEWFEERQAVRTYLGLQGSTFSELQEGFAVLTPLVASISSLLLDLGR